MFVLLSFCLSPAGDVTNKRQLRPTKVVHYNEITANNPTKKTPFAMQFALKRAQS